MSYEAVIYRPPREAMTPLLPVTSGCSHNRCSFCNMYRDVPFKMYSLERIREDLIDLSRYYHDPDRIYLVGGDPFVMKADFLHRIIDEIEIYMPTVRVITMYASVLNIMTKTDDELRALRARGVDQLYIGLETGSDELLKKINKGNTAQDAITQLNRLTTAGIRYGVIIMTGLAGKGGGIENAKATAAVMNQIQARVLYCNSLVVMEDTPLGRDRAAGRYTEAGEYERVEELLTLFEHLHPKSKLLVNSYHVSNALNINAEVPDEQEATIARLKAWLTSTTPEEIQCRFDRQNMRI